MDLTKSEEHNLPQPDNPLNKGVLPPSCLSETIIQGPYFCGTFTHLTNTEITLKLRSLPHVGPVTLDLNIGPFPAEFLSTLAEAIRHQNEIPRPRDPLPAIYCLECITQSAYEANYDVTFMTPEGYLGVEAINYFCDTLFARVSDIKIHESIIVDEVAPGIICLDFPNHYLLTSSFLRIAENYESPKFRNTVFRREEFMEWYKSESPDSAFTYFSDWTGYYVPDYIISRFRNGDFHPLERREEILINLIPEKSNSLSVIAMSRSDPETLRHELCHALYYLSPAYRAEVVSALQGVDVEPIAKILRDFGYTEEVIPDEVNAYLCDDSEQVDDRPIDSTYYGPVHIKLREIFERHLAAARGCFLE